MSSFDSMWSALEPIGRAPRSGGYRRFAWTREDSTLREWFAGEATARGLEVVTDRAGNQWAWQGDPDATPGLVVGSHLDSVPDGGAFDGPLGVVSAFAALDVLRGKEITLGRPLGIVNFGDEEGARFGVACAGSRLITGALDADRARSLADADGVTMADAMAEATGDWRAVSRVGRDDETLRRVGHFAELHVEQGCALAPLGAPIGVAGAIWPHGRWRIDLPGEANHAGTTALDDRRDPMLVLARLVEYVRRTAATHGGLATVGKLRVEPNGVNAIASHVTAWLDTRAADAATVRAMVADIAAEVEDSSGGGVAGARATSSIVEESWTDRTTFDTTLRDAMTAALTGVPVLDTGAGHDAGVLAAAGIPSGMIFVRNPTGVSHSPAEFAERDDCLAGVDALATVIAELAR